MPYPRASKDAEFLLPFMVMDTTVSVIHGFKFQEFITFTKSKKCKISWPPESVIYKVQFTAPRAQSLCINQEEKVRPTQDKVTETPLGEEIEKRQPA